VVTATDMIDDDDDDDDDLILKYYSAKSDGSPAILVEEKTAFINLDIN
jgi:hypothetical protein